MALHKFCDHFERIERWLLYLMVITLPVRSLPKHYPIPGFLHDLPYTFLVTALVLSAVYYAQKRNLYGQISKRTAIYVALCIFWPILCTVIGAVTFPYWDATADDFIRDTGVVKLIAHVYPAIMTSPDLLHLKYGFSMVSSTIKGILIPLLGIPFVTYVAFYNKDKTYILDVVSKAAVFAALALCLYSLIEIPWLLTGNEFCADVMKTINIHLYDVKTTHEWWPPLLWNNPQLRSFTQEPSFFGIISMFLLPLLWYRAFGLKEKKVVVLLILFTYMIYMTKARTAQAILLGELIALVIFSFVGKYRHWGKTVGKILVTTVASFFLFLAVPVVIAHLGGSDMSLRDMARTYFADDLASVASVDQRSNLARWRNSADLFIIGAHHVVFGVGTGFESPFIADYMPEFAKDSHEVQHWIAMLREEGFLQSPIPMFNTFGEMMARYGLMGLCLFVLPIVMLCYRGLKYRKVLFGNYGIVCVFVCVCGQLACLISNTFFYSYPLVISVALCLAKRKLE